MDSNKGQTIFLSVIGIATLLVAIIGATFAWFSVNVQGNDRASSIIVTTAVLGSVTFTDGSVIDLSNIRPEDTPTATKTFSVANATEDLSREIEYYVDIEVTANTLSAAVNQTQGASGVTGDWFVHAIEVVPGSTTDLTSPNLPSCTPAYVSTGTELDPFIAVPNVGTTTLGTNAMMCGAATHTYTYTIKFVDSNSNQNAGQGTTFYGKLQVHTTDSGASSS